jgi:hypothetical protein
VVPPARRSGRGAGRTPHGVDGVVLLLAHLVVDDDRSLHREAARNGKVDVRPDPGGDDHEVARDLLALLEADTADLVGSQTAVARLDSGALSPTVDW